MRDIPVGAEKAPTCDFERIKLVTFKDGGSTHIMYVTKKTQTLCGENAPPKSKRVPITLSINKDDITCRRCVYTAKRHQAWYKEYLDELMFIEEVGK